jgi:hypothetical protein
MLRGEAMLNSNKLIRLELGFHFGKAFTTKTHSTGALGMRYACAHWVHVHLHRPHVRRGSLGGEGGAVNHLVHPIMGPSMHMLC